MSWITNFTAENSSEAFYKVLPASPELRPWVRYYWVIKWGHLPQRTPELLVPDGLEEIIFSYDSPFIRQEIAGNAIESFNIGSYLVGCKGYTLLCSRMSTLSMVGVKLYPGSLSRRFSVPLKELDGQAVGFSEFNYESLNVLEDLIYLADDCEGIKTILDEHLKKMFVSVPRQPLVNNAAHRLYRYNGDVTIGAMAEYFGVSARRLQQLFSDQVGISPKAYADILRFKKLFYELNKGCKKQYFQRLEACGGFYDQPHLIKSFKRYLSKSPKNWFESSADISANVLEACFVQDFSIDTTKNNA